MLILALLVGVVAANPVTITNHWYGGFEGDFTVTGEAHNWKVHLKFSHPVDKVEVSDLIEITLNKKTLCTYICMYLRFFCL
jgi:hypothetical protein